MQVDKITQQDIGIFTSHEEQSIFHVLNNTQTVGGRDYLEWLLANPLTNIAEINDTQQTIQLLLEKGNQLPNSITNGTIMVVHRFFETPVESYSTNANIVSAFLYKLVYNTDYSITRYSVEHFGHFVKGMLAIQQLFASSSIKEVHTWCTQIDSLLQREWIKSLLQLPSNYQYTPFDVVYFGNQIRYHYKQQTLQLIDVYSKIDAYLSLAIACKKYALQFPVFTTNKQPYLQATALYHLLLQTPTSYGVDLHQQQNFLFLTGANMAGKSTFIKALGLAIYLAHIGMAVPAKTMQLSFFDGLLSNINVADNILKGESYFFNEVQRIKSTVEKISDGKNWLILIDELFKGTNVQDAMKCSTTVIEGLHKMDNALFVLSTHLYEIGDVLRVHKNIQFKYFATTVHNKQLQFSYELKEGISNDRLGYLILENEGVVDMLERL
jgi:DNA mismatch repair protein MutS